MPTKLLVCTLAWTCERTSSREKHPRKPVDKGGRFPDLPDAIGDVKLARSATGSGRKSRRVHYTLDGRLGATIRPHHARRYTYTPDFRPTAGRALSPLARTVFVFLCVDSLSNVFVARQFFDVAEILGDIGKRPFITIGFTSVMLMVPLAVTSTGRWIRRLMTLAVAASAHLSQRHRRCHSLLLARKIRHPLARVSWCNLSGSARVPTRCISNRPGNEQNDFEFVEHQAGNQKCSDAAFPCTLETSS